MKKAFDIDYTKCLEINNQWNESIKPIREARTLQQQKLKEEDVLQRMAAHQDRIIKQQLFADEIVRAEKVHLIY